MDALPSDNDYACFIDHDAMFTTSDWYPQMTAIVKAYPDVGAFGCRTNRNGHTFQLVGNIDMNNHDISYHRTIGSYLQKEYYDDVFCIHGNVKDLVGPHRSGNTEQPGFSGTLILLKKSAWRQMGKFQTEEFVHTDASGSEKVTDGFLHVDSEFRKRLARHHIPFYIMNGVYVYHWYRADDPYPHTADALKKIDDAFAGSNKQNFDLNKIFLFDK